MATKLKKMRLTSVDLVRAGANQRADICLYKSADPQEATGEPTEHEKGIFKRFLGWLLAEQQTAPEAPQDPVWKADEPTTAEIYKSAITESLQSIAADESLTPDEKNSLIEKSLGQYHDAMVELLAKADEDEEPYDDDSYDDDSEEYDDPEDEIDDEDELVGKSDRYDYIEEVEP